MGICDCCKKEKTEDDEEEENKDEKDVDEKFTKDNYESNTLFSDNNKSTNTNINNNNNTNTDINQSDTSLISEKRNLSMEDFEQIKLLGTGSFGEVYLVKYIKTSKLYAMKILKKSLIKRNKEEDHTKTERKILEKLTHPFIVNLFFAFQDNSKLYLVTEFMQGGELFYHLHREKYFTNERTQFYAAEMLLALEHLHKNNCIYRDLKPENVLLDVDGHIKLTDFGLSKITLSNANKAYTICGTPAYLAPEILENKGYDKSVDFWSLGVLIYEMLAGYSPFKLKKGQSLDLSMYKKNIPLYNHFLPEAKKIITDLLVVNPAKRLGYGKNGIENIKKHPFFKEINWDDLLNKKITPPFIPDVKSDMDLSNFDKMFTSAQIQIQNSYKKNNNFNDDFEGFSYIKPGVGNIINNEEEDQNKIIEEDAEI